MFKIDLADISTTICTASIMFSIDASLKLLLIVATSPKLKSLTALISSVSGLSFIPFIYWVINHF
jgi:hypothetical protein